ncbi:MAG: family 78 glycoside hydrolase catalytic domain [Bacteroidales bacterium]|nr:family 78 glycoside hydrolase catalytic domain [Bacteroidales bacterium]
MGLERPHTLRCEYKTNPLGIDIPSPRLSWKIHDPHHVKGQKQTSYQILVARSPENLKRNQGDLWNSGRVTSGNTINVTYAGSTLTSEQVCYWKVRVWDKDGRESPYSSPAIWSMGLLNTSTDWDGAKWISHPLPEVEYKTVQNRAEGTSYSSQWNHSDTVSYSNVKGSSVSFSFYGTSVQWIGTRDSDKGIAELYVDGVKVGEVDCYSAVIQSGQVLFSKDHLLWPGEHTLIIKVKGEKNIASGGWNIEVENFKYSVENKNLPPASYWRKDFKLPAKKKIKRAMVYSTALGAYELHINGNRVGEDYFNPGWTQFTTRMNGDVPIKPHRVYYHAYDVTLLLNSGNNAIGAILSTGWYAGTIWASAFNYGAIPELLAKLKIEYADGTSEILVTDGEWKHTYSGPIREADIQQGEIYDARMEMTGWANYGYDETGWSLPQIVIDAANNIKYGAAIQVQAHPAQPVRKTETREPVEVTDVGGGRYVVKFDQQMSGWIEFRGVDGDAGNKIKLQYTSAINPGGTIYTDHLRDMRGQDYYIMNGSGNEGWEPRFTYHGFQYVEITGWPGVPTTRNFTAHVVHTDAPLVSTFDCSEPPINKLHKMVEWSIRTNTIDIPVACADRAERLGWMGDRNAFLETEFYFLDTPSFLTKWMQDIADAQTIGVSGTFHQVCPIWGDIESPGWSEAGMNLPHVMLKFYGDTTLSNRYYNSLHDYASHIEKSLDSDYLRTGSAFHSHGEEFAGYGDWLAIDEARIENAPRFNTIQNYASIIRMAEISKATGRDSDASHFKALAEKMKNSFNNTWVNSKGVIVGETQTNYAMAFDYDLIKDNHPSVGQVKEQFINEIMNK